MNKEYYSIKRFKEWIKAKEFATKNLKGWIFRGQINKEWLLETTIERIEEQYDKNVDKENYESKIFKEFIKLGRNYIDRFPNEKECIEMLSEVGRLANSRGYSFGEKKGSGDC